MGLFEKIEKKRQEVMSKQTDAGIGTLSGLAKMIKKRQIQALGEGTPETPKRKEKADAK